ncbi:hypothetical protein EDC94DRAFT_610091 [Helicostylum pulchrum]|nr:hypothetical protein EDC94DRAFT_610091 [Helicostylum pulchrum]
MLMSPALSLSLHLSLPNHLLQLAMLQSLPLLQMNASVLILYLLNVNFLLFKILKVTPLLLKMTPLLKQIHVSQSRPWMLQKKQ